MILIILLIYFLISIYTIYSELAQLAEHLTVNQVVAGSSPAFGAKTKKTITRWSFCFARNAGYSPETVVPASQPLKSYARLTAPYQVQGLLLSLLCWENFGENNYQLFSSSFPSIRKVSLCSVLGFFFLSAPIVELSLSYISFYKQVPSKMS